MLKIVENEDIMEHISEYDVILIGTNVYCTLSQGVQRDIALNYPYVREKNFQTKYGDIDKMGTILECTADNEPFISLLYICRGYPCKKVNGDDYLSYESLEKCLKLINIKYKGLKIACPLLGCSRFDGNGNKEKVLEIFNNCLKNVDITIYDYFQQSRNEKQIATRKKELAVKSKDYDAYYEMVKKRKEEAEKRFLRNGYARY
jgi:hypothetical protein